MIEGIKNIRRNILGKFRILMLRIGGASIQVGTGFFCARHVYITRKHKVKAGNNVFIGRYVHIASHLEIGNDVMIASQVSFVGGDHKIDGIGEVAIRYAGQESEHTTVIGDNVWIGHGAIIMSGVKISNGAVVAAGAIVTKDVEKNSVVGGTYAKLIRVRR
jgi:acetyltransferase-like isoleucine patch superfamily enzyme